MYNPPDVRWDVLIDIMSQYYLHIHRIFGLAVFLSLCGVRRLDASLCTVSDLPSMLQDLNRHKLAQIGQHFVNV
ncbi:hypothetical protein PILCRDRAFT_595538 [Piloderma croceum F 1598]|uniref:Uncharacterized protein n=1 Tax=Piloderma croceum (strain F 1598) TaxID=765440 RepID=A0A0C3FED8_PILCF|nr:hypothetical protein PILCRDRAFT_595538 [Piloderma croceum F 1598]